MRQTRRTYGVRDVSEKRLLSHHHRNFMRHLWRFDGIKRWRASSFSTPSRVGLYVRFRVNALCESAAVAERLDKIAGIKPRTFMSNYSYITDAIDPT